MRGMETQIDDPNEERIIMAALEIKIKVYSSKIGAKNFFRVLILSGVRLGVINSRCMSQDSTLDRCLYKKWS